MFAFAKPFGGASISWSESTKQLVINNDGGTDPGLEVYRADGITHADITATTYGVDGGGIFHGRFARGTRASPTAALADDITGGIGSRACYQAGSFQTSSPASIHWQVTENQSSTAYGMWIRLLTTPKGSTTRREVGGITDNQTIWSHDNATAGYNAKSNTITLPVADARFVATSNGGAGGQADATFVAASYGTDVTPGFRGVAFRGTPTSPTAVGTDDTLCFMGGHGYDGSTVTAGTKALIRFRAGENWSGSNQGTYIAFEATPNGSTTRAEILRLQAVPTTGAQTATFAATNKPGSGTAGPTAWLPVVYNSTTYYIPMFGA